GKTAPRILEDLYSYDPRRQLPGGRNILAEPPPLFDKSAPPIRAVPKGSCRHVYMAKYSQSVLPDHDIQANSQTKYKVAAFCQECLSHVDLTVDYGRSGWPFAPCPNTKFPLHHFLRVEAGGQNGSSSTPELDENGTTYHFVCSAETCPVGLNIRLRRRRFKLHHEDLLTNPVKLKARLQAAKKLDPHREDLRAAEPHEGLVILATYLLDSLEPAKSKLRIPLLNRKFLQTFGQDCDEMFTELGFEREVASDNNNAVYWHLPKMTEGRDLFDPKSARSFVEDMREELLTLAHRKVNGPLLTRNAVWQPELALKDFQRCLGCVEYKKAPISRRTQDPYIEDHPYYASLGAVSDFADDLLLFAYDRQVKTDPRNSPYYFDCLGGIAKGRESEDLELKVATLASSGQIGREEVLKAFAYLAIDSKHNTALSDDNILGHYRARLRDTPESKVGELQQMLRIIGRARNSELIIQAATNTVETYEQALTWLDAQETTPDDFIGTLYTLKVQGNAKEQEVGRKAVELIAKHRKSDVLHRWLETGDMTQPEMDTAQAYSMFEIADRAAPLDLQILEYMREARVHDAPDREAEINLAFNLIQKDKGLIGQIEMSGSTTLPTHPVDKWPVGLQNIGNTCYLNSLLQYYFTIKPLRELVLKFEDFKMELTPENISAKRVGGRRLTLEEAERSQLFVEELKKLFQTMITSTQHVVRPETDLAVLTLLDAGEEDKALKDEEPSQSHTLGSINGAPIIGPILPPPLPKRQPPPVPTGPILRPLPTSDSSSDTTLVDKDPDTEMVEKPPTSDKMDDTVLSDKGLQSTSSDDTNIPTVTPPTSSQPEDSTGSSSPGKGTKESKTQQTRATKPASVVLNKFDASQRDVTEVIDNVLFQLQAAIKPQSIGSSGEQVDLIRELFFGSYLWHYLENANENKTEAFNNIVLNVLDGPCDIYTALDGHFDVDSVESEHKVIRRFCTIHDPIPPILQIYSQNLSFDRDTGSSTKVEHHLRLYDQIFMDRYISSDNPEILRRRQKSWEWKAELERLKEKKLELTKTEAGMSMPDVLESTLDFIKEFQAGKNDDDLMDVDPISVDKSVRTSLEKRAAQARQEIEHLDGKIGVLTTNLQTLFVDLNSHSYKLFAMFMHRGSARGGHYFIYIKDFARNQWRRYNDDRVEEVTNENTIFEQERTKPPATPYYIVYVREDKVRSLIDALHRRP
ncbi:cysteine proteinase, partial [Patellaria atrata CBS 101060]